MHFQCKQATHRLIRFDVRATACTSVALHVRSVPLQAHKGGLVSPSGLSYIGHTYLKPGDIPAAAACKRMVLDEAIAKAAVG